jgi:hypothetical protein
VYCAKLSEAPEATCIVVIVCNSCAGRRCGLWVQCLGSFESPSEGFFLPSLIDDTVFVKLVTSADLPHTIVSAFWRTGFTPAVVSVHGGRVHACRIKRQR